MSLTCFFFLLCFGVRSTLLFLSPLSLVSITSEFRSREIKRRPHSPFTGLVFAQITRVVFLPQQDSQENRPPPPLSFSSPSDPNPISPPFSPPPPGGSQVLVAAAEEGEREKEWEHKGGGERKASSSSPSSSILLLPLAVPIISHTSPPTGSAGLAVIRNFFRSRSARSGGGFLFLERWRRYY